MTVRTFASRRFQPAAGHIAHLHLYEVTMQGKFRIGQLIISHRPRRVAGGHI
ncbi:hypothetical protein [Nocardia australiensis]|uniref:hypothetical protein n=1 Tax=Nocardia australiensis TaxID=2887191 RepID=UPI001D15B303|nr:hypothetical protein [Nocardia australiensis]